MTEIKEGVNGSGNKIWLVFSGKNIEYFNTLEEAECWVKWACTGEVTGEVNGGVK